MQQQTITTLTHDKRIICSPNNHLCSCSKMSTKQTYKKLNKKYRNVNSRHILWLVCYLLTCFVFTMNATGPKVILFLSQIVCPVHHRFKVYNIYSSHAKRERNMQSSQLSDMHQVVDPQHLDTLNETSKATQHCNLLQTHVPTYIFTPTKCTFLPHN